MHESLKKRSDYEGITLPTYLWRQASVLPAFFIMSRAKHKETCFGKTAHVHVNENLPCQILFLGSCPRTSNARFWVWVHLLVNLVAMAFLFTMNLYLPWVLNSNLSQARLIKETACNYVFSVLVHGMPSISAWISIHQNSQKLSCANTSIGR